MEVNRVDGIDIRPVSSVGGLLPVTLEGVAFRLVLVFDPPAFLRSADGEERTIDGTRTASLRGPRRCQPRTHRLPGNRQSFESAISEEMSSACR